MKAFFLALSILSRIPVPYKLYDGLKPTSRATRYFPVVGVLLGLILASLTYGLSQYLPAFPLAVFIVALMAGISGAFHLDGLADCADGFLSSRPREQVLEIMKDSRIGAMGSLALIFMILLKVSLLVTLTEKLDVLSLSFAVLLSVLAGRCALVWHMKLTKVLGEGLGKSFWNQGWSILLISLCVFGLGVHFLLPSFLIKSLVIQVLISLMWSFYCRAKIAGGTGDTLGASCELAEAGFFLGLVL